MSRSNKHQQKLKRRQHRKELSAARPRTPPSEIVCSRAAALMKGGSWQDARNVLQEYEQQHPGHPEVLRQLLDVYHELREYAPYCLVCRRLIELQPDNHVLRLMLAAGNLSNANLASAFLAFQGFVELCPSDPLAIGARETIEQLKPAIEELLAKLPFAVDDRLECAALHEQVMTCLTADDCREAIRIGEQLLTRCPDFLPVLNNLSEAYFRRGQVEQAIVMSQKALRLQPDNVHALSNLTRHLYLNGQHRAAEELAPQLLQAPADSDDQWCKKCEALSFLGDDEAVRTVFAEADGKGSGSRKTPAHALLYHLGAVAYARLGDARQAKRCWRQSLKVQPGFQLASEGLADAAKPVRERHGPWYFPLRYWLREELMAELSKAFGRVVSENAATRAARNFAEAHPEVVGLVPALLDRGDKVAREFAWRMAMLLDTPEMQDTLRVFCQSQRGPDDMRLETANDLHRAGVLPPGPLRIWVDGRSIEVQLLGFEITREPVGNCHGLQADEWVSEGCQMLREGNGVKAAELFQRCIDLEGEAPDLLNNLAAAYEAQGRTGESRELAQEIHKRWPDYFFGQIAAANMATMAGDYELSERYLAALRQRQQLHITEFTALAAANIHLLLRRGNVPATQPWLDMWRKVEPEDPNLRMLELRCSKPDALSRLANLFFRQHRKR